MASIPPPSVQPTRVEDWVSVRVRLVAIAHQPTGNAVAQVAIKPAKSAAEAKTAIEGRQALFKDIKKNYEKSDVLQVIRILKNYDFLNDTQMELFGSRKRKKRSGPEAPSGAQADAKA